MTILIAITLFTEPGFPLNKEMIVFHWEMIVPQNNNIHTFKK